MPKKPIKGKNKKRTNKNKVVDKRRNVNIKTQIKKVNVGVKNGIFIFTSPLTIGELAPKLDKTTADVIKYFFMKGLALTINSILSIEQIAEFCIEIGYDFKVEMEINEENVLENITFDDDKKSLKKRAPIITIMGHVDHGKTTLLDTIRKSNVTKSESGGITQHIGAYQVKTKNGPITFIDTPGHAAFTEMRARGANVTDIVILVVAADDGLKPQTEEAIDHAKAAKTPIIVFVNKMDKEGANPDKVYSQLSAKDIVAESWDGDTIFVQGSALKGDGIKELLEAINVLAETMELKANPNRLAYGSTIEANLDKGYGPVATLLVQNGTLEKGDYVVIGATYGKIRMMLDEANNEVLKALPSRPIKVAGLESVPQAGDRFLALKDEKEAHRIADIKRMKLIKEERFHAINSDIKQQVADGLMKNVNIVLRADVHGSLEAIKQMIPGIKVSGATATLIRTAVGGITESDVRLAHASNAIVIGFNIRPNKQVKDIAKQTNVELKTYDIIYKLKEDIESILKGSLDPIFVEEIIGEAEVRQLWKHSDIGTICGCRITSGKIKRNAKARVIRDGKVIYNSQIATLQHGKEQKAVVGEGKDCGLTIKNFNDVKENDVIEAYLEIEKSYDEVNK